MPSPPRVLIVGCGFGGFYAARALERRLPDVMPRSPWSHPRTTCSTPRCCPRWPAACWTRETSPCRWPARCAPAWSSVGCSTSTSSVGWRSRPTPRDAAASSAQKNASCWRPAASPGRHRSRGWPSTPSGSRPRPKPRTCAITCCSRLRGSRRPRTTRSRAARSTFVVIGAGFAGTELVDYLQRLAAAFARRTAAAGTRSRHGGCWSTPPHRCCPSSARAWAP